MTDATFIGDKVLRVAAVKWGTIADCFKFQVESIIALRGGLDALFSEIRRLGLPQDMFNKPYIGGTTYTTAFGDKHTGTIFHSDPRVHLLGIYGGLDENYLPKRTTIDSLKQIGVKLECLELV